MTLLERLEASLAALKDVPPDEALRQAQGLAGAAAQEAAADLRAWIAEGSAIVGQLWDLAERVDSPQLLAVLHDLTDREAGIQGALAMLQRHLEAVLGDRHGRGPIMDPEGFPLAQVDRHASSTKWNVDDAWPDLSKAIRAADRLPIGDPADGKLEDDTAKALRWVRQLAGISYLKVGALEQLALDPDDYREKGPRRWVVKLP